MTISESIIKWLKGFDADECKKIKSIDTDIQSAKVDTYSLVKEPVQNVRHYMSGVKAYTDHYIIQARLSSQTNSDRIDNTGFGEALSEWVLEKNSSKDFPAIEDARVQEIKITTPFYIGKTETNNSIYQMTIAIKYEKER